MAETLNAPAIPESDTDLEAAVKQIFQQMAQADARIRAQDAEIARLKAETRAILTELQRQLPEANLRRVHPAVNDRPVTCQAG